MPEKYFAIIYLILTPFSISNKYWVECKKYPFNHIADYFKFGSFIF